MKIKGAKIIITGGAGFIGSHLVQELLGLGAKVTVYDNFSFGSFDNLSKFKKDIEIIKGDILDFELLNKSMVKQDIVSHHAAQLEIFLSIENPYKDLETNAVGTLNVLRAARNNNIGKVINASSACIYGQTLVGTSENHLPMPNWAYGISKLAAERYCSMYNNSYQLPVVNLRYGITFGEREWFRRVLTIFIKRAILDKPLVVFGSGDQIRDFVYVKDAVRLHNLCIENDQINGQSYNVGTGIPIKIIDLAKIINNVARDIFKRDVSILYEDTAEGEHSKLVPEKKRNPSELKMMLLNCSKAFDDLGWKAEISLAEGIKNEMLWASENISRWSNLNYTSAQNK